MITITQKTVIDYDYYPMSACKDDDDMMQVEVFMQCYFIRHFGLVCNISLKVC